MTLVAPRRAETYEHDRAPRIAPPPAFAPPPAHRLPVPSYAGHTAGLRHAAPRDPGPDPDRAHRPPGAPAPHSLPVRPRTPRSTAPAPPTDALVALLAEDPQASGVLLSGSGALYLRRGEVVHAESPAAPTLDALLTAGGRLTPEAWRQAVDQAGGDGLVGRHLVEQHRLHAGELEITHLATLFDAAYFTLAPDAGPVRFRPGAAHWLGPIRPVSAHALARECRRRRVLLDRAFPDPRLDVAPVRRHPAAPPPRAAFRRAVLDHADGVRTPGDIAHLLGRPAFHVLAEVRRMAAAGLVAPPHPDPDPPDGPPPPRPRPGHPADTEPPDIELLRRIRDALEARL